MPSIETVGSVIIKVVKLVINLILLILYRTGYGGQFLGVGGTWNLNEEKNPDAEIVASGVFVGFFIYTAVVLITFCFGSTHQKKTLTDLLMNIIGFFLFAAVGATAIHYWSGYQMERKHQSMAQEKQIGLALGSLSVISAAIYLVDAVLTFIHYARQSD